MVADRSCRACEFNSNSVCIGHGCTYKYGEDIIDQSLNGCGLSIGLEYFTGDKMLWEKKKSKL